MTIACDILDAFMISKKKFFFLKNEHFSIVCQRTRSIMVICFLTAPRGKERTALRANY